MRRVMMRIKSVLWGAAVAAPLFFNACQSGGQPATGQGDALSYCVEQVQRTIGAIGDTTVMPIRVYSGQHAWSFEPITAWTSGFWPGILWYADEAAPEAGLRPHAEHYTRLLEPLSLQPPFDHDLGFQLFCSYGHAYRLTGEEAYKSVILRAADTLATLYDPTVGTILSWPWVSARKGWPHNTIIDNMMNLELLFWASRNGGADSLYEIAHAHAKTTMDNHFRPDGSCYHVAVYDTTDGRFLRGVTHQGYADSSAWARGQAWAIYGFTMAYRETGDAAFLPFVEKITAYYLGRLPDDRIPYWDFDDPSIPDAPRDASAAAIVASALIELSQLVGDAEKQAHYLAQAKGMLESLGSEGYRSGGANPSLLLHSTGNWPANSEIDASIIYADYYYIEALMRLKTLEG